VALEDKGFSIELEGEPGDPFQGAMEEAKRRMISGAREQRGASLEGLVDEGERIHEEGVLPGFHGRS
jgi:hypothetical protein